MNFVRLVFCASAVLFGIVGTSMRFGSVVAWCCGAIAQIAGGLGILNRATSRPAAVLLGLVYLLFALVWLPGIADAPARFVQYYGLVQSTCYLSGVLAIYAASETDARRSATLARAARIGLGVCTIYFGLAQIVYFHYTASLVPTWLPPSQPFWTALTTAAFILAAIAMLIDRQARRAMNLMALMLALFGVLVWVPHIVARPTLSNWNELATNYMAAAVALAVAAAPNRRILLK